jgi:lysophospholipase L1-like esterase
MFCKKIYFDKVLLIKALFKKNIAYETNLLRASLLFFFLLNLVNVELNAQAKTNKSEFSKIWVGTWATAPMLVEPNNMPPAPGLTNNTVRQIVRVSIGGDVVRLRFTNVFSKSPVTIKSVAIAVSKDGCVIDASTQKLLTFNKKKEVTMVPNGEITSDPLSFNLKQDSKIAITINFGETSPDVTGHPGSRTTSYILAGDQISSVDFTGAINTDHWYVINAVEVQKTQKAGTVAILGNSITDGRGSGTNKQNRWTDILSERMLMNSGTSQLGVLNLGIGGNCIVRGGLGPTANSRFDRDILGQNGVRWLIILEGINDIGGIRSSDAASKIVSDLINSYSQMIDKAHAKGIKVYGATILPFAKSFYDADFRQAARDSVNAWIRNSGRFDAVIDFDKVMRTPDEPRTILSDVHSGDFLHPNELGYKKMGESIDLDLFK